ncbi:MAG: hypothetical protein JOZ10_16175 [Acidobacteria bacterium]|nr:hypothetical protein [Acidobacteriota bacterium]
MPPPATPGEILIADLTAPGTHIVAHLAKDFSFDPDVQADLAALVECDFPGYAAVPITDWADVLPGNPDVAEVVSAPCEFVAGDAITSPQQAKAVYITGEKTGEGLTLMQLVILDPPFVFVNPNDKLERQVRMAETTNEGPSVVE